jgi:CubicO group peptidase (beta-lactamase class C family)
MKRFLAILLVVIGTVFILFSALWDVHWRVPTIFDGRILGGIPLRMKRSSNIDELKLYQIPDISLWTTPEITRKFKNIHQFLQRTSTTAFVVVKDGRVIFEYYGNGVEKGDITQIFSVTKVLVTALLGIAMNEGYIATLDQPVSDFLPDYRKKKYSKLTLRHLVQMQSGLDYDEYGRIFQTLRFYYQQNVNKLLQNPEMKHEPGMVFTYKSIDTQILAECLEKAVGMPLTDYFKTRLWDQLEPEDSTSWSYDSPWHRKPKYFGGLNASARDIAKFGVAVAQDGKYKGKQIIPAAWLNMCDDVSCRNGENFYCNGWWYGEDDEETNCYFGAGFNGQTLFINETTQTVIVRLGKNKGGVYWYPLFKKLSLALDQNS